MSIKVFHDPIVAGSRALMIFIKMNKLPAVSIINLPKEFEKGNEFDQHRSDLNSLPVLYDGDFRLAESGAIIRYLCSKFPVEDFWYPKEPKEGALVDEFLSWRHNNIRVLFGDLVHLVFRMPFITGKANECMEEGFRKKKTIELLKEMEEKWMDHQFISGDNLTVADLFAVCDLEECKNIVSDPYNEYPKLAAWNKRVLSKIEPYFSEEHH